jgi:hypothetical protein
VSVADLLRPPPRRDVRGMTDVLASLKAGDYVSATMKLDKYGVVNIQGFAYWSNTQKNFLVGRTIIDSGLRPDKSVLSLTVSAAPPAESEVRSYTTRNDNIESLQDLADTVVHGDVVRATFDQKPYGQFIITGTAVQTADKAVLAVGTLFIAERYQMVDLEVLGTASAFGLPSLKPLVWDVDQVVAT